MRVRQPRRGLRFAQEADAYLLSEAELGGQHFDRHLALHPLVTGFVHDAHPAATELPLDGVGASQRLDQACGERLVGLVHSGVRWVYAPRFSRVGAAVQPANRFELSACTGRSRRQADVTSDETRWLIGSCCLIGRYRSERAWRGRRFLVARTMLRPPRTMLPLVPLSRMRPCLSD